MIPLRLVEAAGDESGKRGPTHGAHWSRNQSGQSRIATSGDVQQDLADVCVGGHVVVRLGDVVEGET